MTMPPFTTQEVDEDFLPLGGHLLPLEYQLFLCRWNKTIATYCGGIDEDGWTGENRKKYRMAFPEAWKSWQNAARVYMRRYKKEVDALKAYQQENMDDSE